MIEKIVLGMWPISGDFGVVSLKNVEKIISYAVDSGIRSFDTAPNYGNGFAEMSLGMIVGNDSRVDIYTKFGNHPFDGKNFAIDLLDKSFRQSLVRLRRDSVKGLFLHNPRHDLSNYSSVMNLLDNYKRSSLIQFSGISGAKGFDYNKCFNFEIDIYQQDANLLYMNELFNPTAKRKYFFARSPLATGILSGRLNSQSVFSPDDHRSSWLKGGRLNSLLKRVNVIKEIIGTENLTSVARRFLIYQPKVDCVVIGVSHISHIDDILADFEKGPLSDHLVEKLENLWRDDFHLSQDERQLGY